MANKNIRKIFADDPEVLRALDAREQNDLLKEMVKGKILDEQKTVEEAKTKIVKVEYLKGEPGDVGPKPVKGEDYFTEEEVAEFKEAVTPVKGVDYFDGEKGKDGKDGRDGESVVGPRGKDGKDGRDGIEISPQQVADKLNTLEGELEPKVIKGYKENNPQAVVDLIKNKQLLDTSHIKGLQTFVKDGIRYKVEELMHGGGSTGAFWINGDGSTTNKLTVSATQPTNPSVNDLWVDIS